MHSPSKLTISVSLAMTCASLAAQSEMPNIVFFLVDDMGWQETSVPFWTSATPLNSRYRTPNMERMARLGTKFTNAYACAISSPSRCSLMSGMNAARHRVTNWTLHYNIRTDVESDILEVPDWHYNGLQPEDASERDAVQATKVTPLPKLLRDAGYYTIHCGKAHFAAEGTAGEDPLRMGFCENIAGGANGAPASYLAENEYGSGPFHVKGLEAYYGTGTFLTEALTIEAQRAMQGAIDKKMPFFLYMSHYAIHVPYDADKRFVGNYLEADGSGKHDAMLNAPLSEAEINHAALVEGMDKSLGDILNFLQARPDVARNTIIIFMSDNGGQAIWPRQGRYNYDQNFPARGGKGSAYEGGVHEPMMIVWPGVTKGGTVNHNRVMVEDFFPTLLSMAGIKNYRTIQHIDGKDIVPLLRHPRRTRERTIVWHYPNLWTENIRQADGYGPYSAIMKGNYHLIYFWETQTIELYDNKADIGYTHNLAAKKPKLAHRLARELTDSLKACDAQRPRLKSTHMAIAWPDETLRRKHD